MHKIIKQIEPFVYVKREAKKSENQEVPNNAS